MSNLTIPLIHINGTSSESLRSDLQDAHEAILVAIAALCKAAPHARDYYLHPDGSFEKARNEHILRIQKLFDVNKELEEIAVAISKQGKN